MSLHTNAAVDELNDSGDLRQHQSPEAREAALRLAADRRLQYRVAVMASTGSALFLILLAVNLYAAVAGAPPIPRGINSVLVGAAILLLITWSVEWLTRGIRRHILGAGSRGYGEGVLDGLKLGSSVGPGCDR